MDFSVPEETRMLAALMRKFVTEECLPVEREMMRIDPDWVELPERYFKPLQNRLKELGLWALGVPKEYGGAGLDTISLVLITVERCKTLLGTSHRNPFGCASAESDPNPSLLSTDYLRDNYYLPMVRGEKRRLAIAQTEPDAGSDAAAIKTTAVRDGDYWVINGTKRFSTMADTADFVLVTTVTDKTKGRAGQTTFVVDAGTPGMRVERIVRVLRDQYSTELVFDNCRVHDRQRLTMEGFGFQDIVKFFGRTRMMMAASCIGRAQRSQEMTIDYVKQRSTFGQLLATRQAIQWMLVDSHIEINATRLMMLEGAWRTDQGMDVRHDAAVAKLVATEMAYRVLDRAIQCHGGIGLTKDLPFERWFREVRVMRIVEGPSEIQKFIIARNILRG